MSVSAKLTDREKAFVAAMYSPAARLCATKAARIAGYSSGGSYGALRVSASRLLNRPRVRRALHKAGRTFPGVRRRTERAGLNKT